MKKFFLHAVTLGFIATPFLASAAGLVPCGGPAPEPTCDFEQLILMINGLIQFILFDLAVPIAALAFMWAGASLVLQQNKEAAWSEAKGRFQDIAVGFVIIMVAFIGIKFILYTFLETDQYNFVKFLIDLG